MKLVVKAIYNNQNIDDPTNLQFYCGDLINVTNVDNNKYYGHLLNNTINGWFDINLVEPYTSQTDSLNTFINRKLSETSNIDITSTLTLELNDSDNPVINTYRRIMDTCLNNTNFNNMLNNCLENRLDNCWMEKTINNCIIENTTYYINFISDETRININNKTHNKPSELDEALIDKISLEDFVEALQSKINNLVLEIKTGNKTRIFDRYITILNFIYILFETNSKLDLVVIDDKPMVKALYKELLKDNAKLLLLVRMSLNYWAYPLLHKDLDVLLKNITNSISCFVTQLPDKEVIIEINETSVNKTSIMFPGYKKREYIVGMYTKIIRLVLLVIEVSDTAHEKTNDNDLISVGTKLLTTANTMVKYTNLLVEEISFLNQELTTSDKNLDMAMNLMADSVCCLIMLMQDTNVIDMKTNKYNFNPYSNDKLKTMCLEFERHTHFVMILAKFFFDKIDDFDNQKLFDLYINFSEEIEAQKTQFSMKKIDVVIFYKGVLSAFNDNPSENNSVASKLDNIAPSITTTNNNDSLSNFAFYHVNNDRNQRSMSSPIFLSNVAKQVSPSIASSSQKLPFNKNKSNYSETYKSSNHNTINTRINFDRRPTNVDRTNINNAKNISETSSSIRAYSQTIRTRKASDAWYLESEFGPDEIVFNNNVVKAGTLPALIERLSSHDNNDPTFVQTFLLTYHSFTTSKEFVDMLIKRFYIKPLSGLNEEQISIWNEYKQKPVRLRVCNVLKNWVENYYNENNPEEVESLNTINNFAQEIKGEMQSTSTLLLKTIEKRKTKISKKLEEITYYQEPPPPIHPKNLTNLQKVKLLDLNPLEVARQLCLIEFEMYKLIKPSDLLNKAWSSKSAESGKNVKTMIYWSNRLTNWVGQMLLDAKDTKKRCSLIKNFIVIAEKCLELNNFSSLVAILAGFSLGAILRLKRTWDCMHGKWMVALDRLKAIIATDFNYSAYRELLHSVNPPCVPFIGMYLKDVTFNSDGNKDKLDTKIELINFAKQSRTAATIREIQQYQFIPYNFKKVELIQTHLKDGIKKAPILSELYEISEKLEPKEREDEKLARLLQESGFL